MATRATISTNIPTDGGGRKVRAAVKEAVIAAAKTHHQRHMPWHFETFATQKYGYPQRSPAYNELKTKLGMAQRPLVFSGKTRAEILSSAKISATGTRGATLKMKCSLLGANTGRVLDVAAIERMLADARKAHAHPRLLRLLARIKKNGGKLTHGQENAIRRAEELKAIAADELKYLAIIEDQTFNTEINRPEPSRTL